MIFSREEMLSIAGKTRFRADVVEKVAHLLNLLSMIFSHPFLKDKLALKGGTALNLFVFDLPRLSVDIDLNVIGGMTREELEALRPRMDTAFQAVFSREGFTVKRVPDEHGGGKWRLGYQGSSGQPGNVEVDINYMLRQPLWDVRRADSRPLGPYAARGIPVLDLHELAAGKLAALFVRHTARDLFDTHRLLALRELDPARLRIAFVVYGGMNRKDWRTISLDDIASDPRETEQLLVPLLQNGALPEKVDMGSFVARLATECRERLAMVFPLNDNEREFLEQLLSQGKVVPSLLTGDEELQRRIAVHPMLNWKALNVRQHFGIES